MSSGDEGYDLKPLALFVQVVTVVWCCVVEFLFSEGGKFSIKMADLEAVLADVSYLMAMEKSKCTPAARASKKIVLPDPRQLQTATLHTMPTRKSCVYSHNIGPPPEFLFTKWSYQNHNRMSLNVEVIWIQVFRQIVCFHNYII